MTGTKCSRIREMKSSSLPYEMIGEQKLLVSCHIFDAGLSKC